MSVNIDEVEETLRQERNAAERMWRDEQAARRKRDLRGIYEHFLNVMIKTWDYAKRFRESTDRELLNIVTGLGGETGEVLDVIKKFYCHTPKPYAEFRQKLVYELGDLLYYFLMCCNYFGITLEEVIDSNKEKLCSRHPELGQVTERFDGNHVR